MRIIIKFTISVFNHLDQFTSNFLNLLPIYSYAPPNVPPVIISAGVSFAPKSIYKTPLSSNTELFSLLTALSLLAPHKIHLKSTSFTSSIALFFDS